jgi:hypothetical protein
MRFIWIGLTARALAACSGETRQEQLARIDRSCQDNYGDEGNEAVNKCKIALMVRIIDKEDHDRADRALRDAGPP